MSSDLYSALEIAENASSEEVKKAYVRMVRLHPPEKDPERFKLIRQAYETLNDLQARKRYDEKKLYGTEAQKLLDDAESAMSTENWDIAKRLLKRLIVLCPSDDNALNLLGICFLRVKETDDAIKTFKSLVQRASDVPLYWRNLGHAVIEKSAQFESRSIIWQGLINLARTHLKTSIQLEPFNATPYRAIAETYLDQDDYRTAEYWAEEAIKADDKLDLSDLDSLFLLCRIYLFSQQLIKIRDVADRIKTFAPEDADTRQRIAYRFAEYADELVNRKAYRSALEFLNAACSFETGDEKLTKYRDSVNKILNVNDQYEILAKDEKIVQPLRTLCALYVSDYFDQSQEFESKRNTIVDNVFNALNQYPRNIIRASLDRIQTQYPSIYDLNVNAFDKLRSVLG